MDPDINFDGCDICGEGHDTQECPELSPDELSVPALSRARLTLPHSVELVVRDAGNTLAVVARETIENKTRLGPFESPRWLEDKCGDSNVFSLKILSRNQPSLVLDASDEYTCNWLCFIQTARRSDEQNLMAVQMGSDIYYVSTRTITVGSELRVWYAPHYAKKLGKSPKPDGTTLIALEYEAKDEIDQSVEQNKNASVDESRNMIFDINSETALPDRTEISSSKDDSYFPRAHKSSRKIWNELSNPPHTGITHPVTANGQRVCRRCGFTAASVRELAVHVKEHLVKASRENGKKSRDKAKKADKAWNPGRSYRNKRRKIEYAGNVRKVLKRKGISRDEVISSRVASEQENPSDRYAKPEQNITESNSDHSVNDTNCESGAPASRSKLHPATPQRTSSRIRSGKVNIRKVSDLVHSKSAGDEHDKQGDDGVHDELKMNENDQDDKSQTTEEENNMTTDLSSKSSQPDAIKTKNVYDKDFYDCHGESSVTGEQQEESFQCKETYNEPGANLHIKGEPWNDADNLLNENVNLPSEGKTEVLHLSEELLQMMAAATASDDVTHVQLSLSNGGEMQLSLQEIQQLFDGCGQIAIERKADENTFDGTPTDVVNNDTEIDKQRRQEEPDAESANLEALEVDESLLQSDQCLSELQFEQNKSTEHIYTSLNLKSKEGVSNEEYNSERGTDLTTSTNVSGKSVFKKFELEKIFKVEDLSAAESEDNDDDYESHIQVQQYMDQSLEGVRETCGIFMCTLCNRRLSTKWRLAKHMCDHPTTTCARCEKCYTSEESMASHECLDRINVSSIMSQLKHGIDYLIKVDENDALYKCQACGFHSEDVTSLLNHVTIHDHVFVCEECGRCFEQKSRYNNHILKCTDRTKQKGVSFVCELCGRLFERQALLKRHLEGHQAVYSCNKCERKFMHNSTYRSHVCDAQYMCDNGAASSDDSSKPHACEFCNRRFKTQQQLVVHMPSHTEEYTCTKCNLHYARYNTWLQHVAKCDPQTLKDKGIDEIFPCKQCDKIFVKEIALINHEIVHLNVFSCEVCGQSFSSEQSQARHSCKGPKPERYECAECGRTFKRRHFLERHLPIHTGEFTCVICTKVFERKDALIKHMLQCTANVQVETSGDIKCAFCRKSFTDAKLFQEHYMTHTHPFGCNTCHQRFMRRINLDKHKCKNYEGQSFECEVCKKKFKSPMYLERHKHVHSGVSWHCDRCGKDFKRPDMWKIHMCRDKSGKRVKIHHKRGGTEVREENVATMCTICGHEFHNKSNLGKHMLRHFDKKEHCPHCDKKFHEKAGLKAHIENMHLRGEKKWRCEICGKRMKCRNSIYAHMKTFHSETQVVYECNECGKQLKSKAYLLKHIENAHTKTQQFICKACNRFFKSLSQLDRHAAWHENGEVYACDFCDASFVMQSDVMQHMRSEHVGHVFVCEFCNQHFKQPFTMKNHMERYHNSEWSQISNRKQYIRNQMTVIEQYTAPDSELWSGLEMDEESTNQHSAQPVSDNEENNRVIVAKLQIPDHSKQKSATFKPLIFQTQTRLEDSKNISEQVLSALKQISNASTSGISKTNESEPSVITIEGNNGQQIPVALPSGLTDGQGFILLPTDQMGENVDKDMPYFFE